MASKKKVIIKNHEEFLEISKRHSDLSREVQFAETSMNEEIDKIKENYSKQIKPHNLELKSTGVLLEQYALENADSLTTKDKRSFETATMVFSFKKGRVITYPKLDKLIELLKKSPFKKLIEVIEKIDKNKIKDLETEDIRGIGLAVEEDVDHLTMTIKPKKFSKKG